MAAQNTASILIVGCGAIGGLFASALASVAKVTVYDANAEHVRAINAQGLRVIGKSPRTARIAATDDPAALTGARFDTVIFLTKSKTTGSALAQLRPRLAGHPLLVTLPNGMGNAEMLLAGCDNVVVRGITMNAGRYVGPGCVENLIEGRPGWGRSAARSPTSARSPTCSMPPASRPRSSPIRWARCGRNWCSTA